MLNGKGYYIWQVERTEAGNIPLIADLAVQTGLSHVLVKIADGSSSYNISSAGVDLAAELTATLQSRGIETWGWHYVYGDSPLGEAQKAIQRVQETGVVGYVIDAESEYKEPGKAVSATTFMNTLRNSLPFYPIALSSYRYPSLHTELPWQEFISQSDFVMPQVYWIQAHDPAAQLTRCLSEYRAMTTLPVIPTGAAFAESGWAPTTSEVLEFLNAAKNNNLSGANFWEWYAARQLPNIWETIANYTWPVALPPPPAPLPNVLGRVWANSLNVRSGPGSSYGIIDVLTQNTRVAVYAVDRGWVKISPDQERWIYAYYLEQI